MKYRNIKKYFDPYLMVTYGGNCLIYAPFSGTIVIKEVIRMDEKIKISAPKSVYGLLKKDCEDFKIIKADASPNMNAFLNAVVSNYYEEFACAEEKLRDEVGKAVEIVPDRYRETVYLNTLKILTGKRFESEDKKSKVFSFKPTKNAEKAVIYIENMLLQNESVSSFYRRLFTAYSQKTKNEREKIVFKENYLLLSKAVGKGVKVCISFTNGNVIKGASVYSVSAAKDELFNYVLFYNGKQNATVRLASVKTVSLLAERSKIPEENAALFSRQVECAAQYPMYNSDREPVKVRLTEKGKVLFSKIYLYRPSPVSVEGDIYTFNCSANQILYYFERFGDSAVILSPKKLGIFMRNYHYFAYKKYKTIYGRTD